VAELRNTGKIFGPFLSTAIALKLSRESVLYYCIPSRWSLLKAC